MRTGNLGATDEPRFLGRLVEASLQARLHRKARATREPLPYRLLGYAETGADLIAGDLPADRVASRSPARRPQ